MTKLTPEQAVRGIVDSTIEYLINAYLYDDETVEIPHRMFTKMQKYFEGNERFTCTEIHFSRLLSEELGDELDDDVILEIRDDLMDLFSYFWEACYHQKKIKKAKRSKETFDHGGKEYPVNELSIPTSEEPAVPVVGLIVVSNG